MITYYKLLDMLNRRGMTRRDLMKAIGSSPNTITKISKNEPVNMKIINDICGALDCQPGDIIEFKRSENDIEKI